jgi:hypothetical protein
MGKRAWYLLLFAPFVGTLWPPLYDRIEPRLWGIPFFYWYQLSWVILTSALLGIAYLAHRERAS